MEEKTMFERIMERHPRVFRDGRPVVVSWVPDGWFELVDQLCTDIETTLGDAIEKLRVHQIKQKFAGLRFYYGLDLPEPEGQPPEPLVREHPGGFRISGRSSHPLKRAVDAVVDAAEAESFKICEWCGSREGVEVVVGGQAAKPANENRNMIGPGLYHTCCAASRGNALTPEKWRARMEAHRARIKRKQDRGPGREEV